MLLLPPSEGKTAGGDGPPWTRAGHTIPALNAERRRVRDAVRAHLAACDPGKLLGARGATLERALEEWRVLDRAPTLPARERYAGVTWAALSPATLSPAGRRALEERALVVSGLWGLLRPGDPVPAYRLRMSASVPPLGVLSRHWRPAVGRTLRRLAGGDLVVDLLPEEHRAAVDAAALGRTPVLRIDLVTEGPGGRRAVGHAGKPLRGLLARAILEEGAFTPDRIAAVRVPGLRALPPAEEAGGMRLVFVAEG